MSRAELRKPAKCTHAIDAMLGSEPPKPEEIDAFLKDRRVPIVEGRLVTFLYRGEAKAVDLQHWIFGLKTNTSFERIEGTDLWYHCQELRRNSRVEYKLLVDHGDHRELIRDPFNPVVARDPYGANSVCHVEGYERPEWTLEDPESRRGTIEERIVHGKSLGSRRVRVYLPARFRRTRRYPLLVVHDGSDYVRYAAFQEVLDNLIHRLEIPPMIVALSDPGKRLNEYAADPLHAHHVVHELLPALEQLYPLSDRPSARGIMGASFGGVAAMSTAWRYPEVFGNLLLQSGSFAFTDIGDHERGEAFDPVVDFVNEFRDEPVRIAEKVFLSCGVYESLIYYNRSLVPLLQQTGMAVRFVESRDGHNWENWRDRLREGLSWLFPGPLWMVYE